MFPRIDSLTEFCMLFYKALETDAFFRLEFMYLPNSIAANTTPAYKAAIAQSINSGVCTSKRTCKPGTYRITNCNAKDDRIAYHSHLFLNGPTLNTGYFNERIVMAMTNSIAIIAVSSCVLASRSLNSLSQGICE